MCVHDCGEQQVILTFILKKTQGIWFNSPEKNGKNVAFWKDWWDKAIIRIGDLVDEVFQN